MPTINKLETTPVLPISISTDIRGGLGSAEQRLFQIAEAGFTHVLWCHYSGREDYIYDSSEINGIKQNFRDTGLQLLDLHAPRGSNDQWTSLIEEERIAGVNTVSNRMKMTAELGGSVVMNHWYPQPMVNTPELATAYWDTSRRTFDDLEKVSRETGVRLAIENMDDEIDTFPYLKTLFNLYPPEYLGLCYDSGHGNIHGDGIDRLEEVSDRLISVHLGDNYGFQRDSSRGDHHTLPFDGTVDWDKLTTAVANSAYKGPASFELLMRKYPDMEVETYLAEAYKRSMIPTQMLESKRQKLAK